MGHGEHDDEPLDEGREHEHASKGAPPDPLDRVWLHPTELPSLSAGFVPGAAARAPRQARPRLWMLPIVGGAAGALITVGVLAVAGAFDRGSSSSPNPGANAKVVAVLPSSAPDAALRTGLSIVAISARDARGTRRGSGVCVRHAGDLLTSARLVGDAKTVDVVTRDGQKHTARVVGRDRTTDLVLLTIEKSSSNVPAAQLAEHTPSAGSPVWIVGATANASSLWMSGGLLSSTDAIVAVRNGLTTSGLLETDASAGAQASGGALIDHDGSVLGIVVHRVASNETTYAMPIGAAVSIAQELYQHGKADHGTAGFQGTDGPDGPTIVTLAPEGPAAQAGARPGDVISAIDGRAVESINDVTAIIRATEPGDTVSVDLQRGDKDLKLAVVLGATRG